MPGMPTAKVAERLLKKRPDLAIVVLTMHEDAYYLREFLKIGARGFVLKKSTGRELVRAIRAVVDGNHYVDPALTSEVVDAYVDRADKRPSGRVGALTTREREVCGLLAYGHTNNEIAEKLSISARTVESHRARIMSKLELSSRADLVRFAMDHGLMPRDTTPIIP
jgi:two-component system response regulator NreC